MSENKKRPMTVKKYLGAGVKVMIAMIVILFLGLQSLNFFRFVFPPEQWYYAYLGFGLTSGGVIAYLVIFKTDSDTSLKKTVAIVMLIVSILGEVATAGFGMQIEAFKSQSFALTESDYSFMVIAVQLLGFSHAIAMIMYFAGDSIIQAFADDDGDGTPNFIDPDYKRWKSQQRSYASGAPALTATTRQDEPQQAQAQNYTLKDLERVSKLEKSQIQARFSDFDTFAAWCSGQFDSISNKNMKRIWYQEINPTQAGGQK